MQGIQHRAQAVQQAATLFALPDVALHPPARRRTELLINVRGHVTGRPPVIPPEAQSTENAAHVDSDPVKGATGFAHVGARP
jgi:hypothetical protein